MNTPRFRLKIAREDFEHLRDLVLADVPRESAAFALAGYAKTGGTQDIIVRRPVAIPASLYEIKEAYHLRVSSQATNGLAALCETNGLGAVICHSHPGDGIPYSPSDDSGERRIASSLRDFIPSDLPIGSLLFGFNTVEGRVWMGGHSEPTPLSEIIVIGDHVSRLALEDGMPRPIVGAAIYDRQIRALGTEGQDLISRAKVAIVGVGGTGSPTAEQLVRLGVRDLVLIDPDELDPSNLTRVYGSFASQRRRFFRQQHAKKVNVVASHLRRISPEAKVKTIEESVVIDNAARFLLDRDFVFLCTDDHWGRSVVNQLAYQYFIPTINVGVSITATEGQISNAIGVVDVLRPDVPCLWCRQFLRSERIAAESIPSAALTGLEEEGYVQGLNEPAPSVISLTTTLSGLAVTTFLHILTGFAGELGAVTRLNYDALTQSLRRGTCPIESQCVCARFRGVGDLRDRGTVSGSRTSSGHKH